MRLYDIPSNLLPTLCMVADATESTVTISAKGTNLELLEEGRIKRLEMARLAEARSRERARAKLLLDNVQSPPEENR
jgi:hypothetical protein